MKKTVFLFSFCLLMATDLFPQTAMNKVKELMTAYAANGQFNGVVLVKKNDKVLYEEAFGLANREWDIPNTTESGFLIGSIGKSITAFMTMILVNDGLIDLNANINRYIPEYEGPGKNQATIHQMLTHTSGIPNHGAIPNLSKKLVRWTYDTDQYLELIRPLELLFEPGKGFAYSGIAYNLLAIICEKVSGREFGDLLKTRIFIPLGMDHTKLDKNLDIDQKRAFGYEYHLLEGFMLPSYIEMCHVKGSGGVLSTAGDLARFDDECFHGHKLLPENYYQKIFTRHVKDWQYYGYGWWLTDKIAGRDTLTMISHGGSTDGYKAYNTRVVEDSTDIIIFQNNYYRTELGVKFEYAMTGEIIDILHGQPMAFPKKSIAKQMGLIIGQRGIKEAIKEYDKLKGKDIYYTSDVELNQLAKELYRNYGRAYDAVEIFRLGLGDYPDSFPLNYFYGELLAETNKAEAIDYFKKCVNLFSANPKNAEYEQEYKKALLKTNEKK